MKKLILATTFLALPATSFAGLEDGTFSGSINLSSNYVSRGLTNSDNSPAIQGGFTYTIPLDEQFSTYAGVWASNVNFNDGDEAQIEMDFTAGVGYTNGNLSLDTGFIYYDYPGAASSLNYDYYEVQANIGYNLDPFFVRAAINYTPDNTLDSGSATYIKLALDYQATEDLKFSSHIGRQYVENNANFGAPDYNEWGLGVSYAFRGLNFGLDYAQNDISSASCAASCDAKFIFSIGKSF